MAVRTREEILKQLNERFGEDSSDATLSLMEDITDTFTDFEQRTNGDGTDWKTKYEENDKMWRDKYKERFMSDEPNPPNLDETDPPKKLTYENLFKEGV